jgi:putative transcriptional regulator
VSSAAVGSLARHLLCAVPQLVDPNFKRSVILMLEHSLEGALGLVLNRPTDLSVAGALPAWDHLATAPAVLYVGGPVEERSGWCLARVRSVEDRPGFVPVLGDLGLLDLELDPTEVANAAYALRLYAGYSGWGPGQLDGELAEEAWFVVDAEPDDPFLPEGRSLWQRILARQGGTLGRISLFPPHPSFN